MKIHNSRLNQTICRKKDQAPSIDCGERNGMTGQMLHRLSFEKRDRGSSSRSALCLLALLLTYCFAQPVVARAQVHIDIREGQFAPIPIALPAFFAKNTQSILGEYAQEIRNTIAADLESSGLFKINADALTRQSAGTEVFPDLNQWRNTRSQALLTSDIDFVNGNITLRYRLWDVYTGAQLLMRKVAVVPEGRRRIAHNVADAIYERLTGEEGYFDTQIAYIAETGAFDKRVRRLAMMDQDGANIRYLTDGSDLVSSPRFAPNGETLAYLRFINKKATAVILDFRSMQTNVLGSFDGLTFGPRYTPDGESVLFAFASAGNSEIYRRHLPTRSNYKLTAHPGIDVSPSMSPDGQWIVFNSGRSGSPQLYVMRSDGSQKRRISFGQGAYYTPVWSPRGDLIAFTLFRNDLFSIGLMEPNGANERILTESWHDEGPSWAPNGRRILFFRSTPYGTSRKKTSGLFSIDITGFNMRRLMTPTDAVSPEWSPRIK